MMDNPLNYIEKIPRSEVYKSLMRELNTFHLKHMIEDIARDPEKTFNLADTPLKGVSPAEICEILEELNWRESDILIDRHWSDIAFWSHEWGFALHLSFNGFEWSALVWRRSGMTKKFTAKEARALGKTSRMAEKELENIYALIKTFAEAGEVRMWYKLPPHKEVVKAVREELMNAGYHIGYGPNGGCYMMRISWA